MDGVSIERMCAGKEFQVESADTENAREEKLLVIPAGLVRRFVFKERRTWVEHTHTHPFNGPLSGTAQVSRYQKGKTNLDFTEARDSGISWAICQSAPRSIDR